MLESGKLIGFALTKDYDAARAFYEGKLGLKFVSLDGFALVMKAGTQMIRIAKVPDFTPLRSTVLGWEVQDIEAVVAWLMGRGVVMEKHAFIQDQKRGIWAAPGGKDKIAWFKDPDGNVLSVSEHH